MSMLLELFDKLTSVTNDDELEEEVLVFEGFVLDHLVGHAWQLVDITVHF